MMDDRFQQEVMRSLGRIESTLEALDRRQDETKDYLVKVSARVGTLEGARERQKGAVAVMAAIVSTVVTAAIALIRGWFS